LYRECVEGKKTQRVLSDDQLHLNKLRFGKKGESFLQTALPANLSLQGNASTNPKQQLFVIYYFGKFAKVGFQELIFDYYHMHSIAIIIL